jgi:hypothetical protein
MGQPRPQPHPSCALSIAERAPVVVPIIHLDSVDGRPHRRVVFPPARAAPSSPARRTRRALAFDRTLNLSNQPTALEGDSGYLGNRRHNPMAPQGLLRPTPVPDALCQTTVLLATPSHRPQSREQCGDISSAFNILRPRLPRITAYAESQRARPVDSVAAHQGEEPGPDYKCNKRNALESLRAASNLLTLCVNVSFTPSQASALAGVLETNWTVVYSTLRVFWERRVRSAPLFLETRMRVVSAIHELDTPARAAACVPGRMCVHGAPATGKLSPLLAPFFVRVEEL